MAWLIPCAVAAARPTTHISAHADRFARGLCGGLELRVSAKGKKTWRLHYTRRLYACADVPRTPIVALGAYQQRIAEADEGLVARALLRDSP